MQQAELMTELLAAEIVVEEFDVQDDVEVMEDYHVLMVPPR